MNKKVVIESTIKSNVSINMPEVGVVKTWRQKGAKINLDFEKLSEIIYDPGVEYLFTSGILYIDDLDVRVKLDLEEEEALENKEKIKVIVLSDKEKAELLQNANINDFKNKVKKMSHEQLTELSNFAIEKRIVGDLEKIDYLKKLTAIDIFKIVADERSQKLIDAKIETQK